MQPPAPALEVQSVRLRKVGITDESTRSHNPEHHRPYHRKNFTPHINIAIVVFKHNARHHSMQSRPQYKMAERGVIHASAAAPYSEPDGSGPHLYTLLRPSFTHLTICT